MPVIESEQDANPYRKVPQSRFFHNGEFFIDLSEIVELGSNSSGKFEVVYRGFGKFSTLPRNIGLELMAALLEYRNVL